MPGKTLTFKLRTKQAELETLRKKLKKFGKTIGMPQKKLFEVNLVLDELFTNITTHGHLEQSKGWVHISLTCHENELQIEVKDSGIAFNPLDAEPPNLDCSLEERSVGGLGLHLVKKLVDVMEYNRCDQKNILKIRKTISTK